MDDLESSAKQLTASQTMVLYVLTRKFEFASASKIAETLGWSVAHVRKILKELREKKLTDFIEASFLSKGGKGVLDFLGTETLKEEKLDPRTKLHFSLITYEQLREMSPHIKKWEMLEKRKKK